MKESDIQRLIMIEVSRRGYRVFRNNVGLLTLADGRKISVGLCVGSCDLIGWTPSGRFLAIEVKVPGKNVIPGGDQENFINQVNKSGGIAFVAHSPEEAINLLAIMEK